MCGFVGCWGGASAKTIAAMSATIEHRGPDGHGSYFAPSGEVALGHRRLSIIDLSAGQQPMTNEDGSIWVVFNGEIYNHRELRKDLEATGHQFVTHCDTEVLVHAYEEYGDAFVGKLNGNFAFAIYDQNRKRCLLARDRVGIRPLFYTTVQGKLYFASELKALLAVPGTSRQVDPQALDQYLSLRYSSGEQTMLAGCRRLPPGCLMVIDESHTDIKRYWDVSLQPQATSEYDAIERLDELLSDSVQKRLMSDVPLGMYLSGGIDSNLILALMARESSSAVKTFSVTFGLPLDETEASRSIAKQFGTDHTELRLPRDSYQLLPDIVRMMDEPLGDVITIPTYFLSQEARKSVKVVLTGEGADEVFGSYVHQVALSWFDRYRRIVPKPLRSLNRKLFDIAPASILDRFFPYPESLGDGGRQRVSRFLEQSERGHGYLSLVEMFSPDDKTELYSDGWKEHIGEEWRKRYDVSRKDGAMLNRLIGVDSRNWLPDYTLFKQDRLTMANSLEGRVPFLDHRLVEFAAGLPVSLKLKGFTAKYLLRKVAERHIPRSTAKRKKAAFYLPLAGFFGDDFREFVGDTLSESSIAADGYFNPTVVSDVAENGLAGDLLSSKRLVSLLMFTLWQRQLAAGQTDSLQGPHFQQSAAQLSAQRAEYRG